MLKKILFIFFFFLFSVIFCFSEIIKDSTYFFEIPKGFIKTVDTEKEKGFTDKTAMINFRIDDIDGNLTEDEYLKQEIAKMPSNFKFIKSYPFTKCSGNSCTKSGIIAEVELTQGKYKIKQIILIVKGTKILSNKTRFYFLVGSTIDNSYENYKKTFENVFNSFRTF